MKNISIVKALVLVPFLLFLISCKGEKENKATDKEIEGKEAKEAKTKLIHLSQASIKVANISFGTANNENISGYLTLPATVAENQENTALVGSLISGRIKKINVKLGDKVSKGQILMEIESFDVGSIKSNYLKAKANVEFLSANYERQKKLYSDNINSQKSIQELKSEFDKAKAELRSEESKLGSIGISASEINSDKSLSSIISVRAPIGGIISEKNVVIGQNVDQATNAFKITNISSVWIDGQAFEKDIIYIKPNTQTIFVADAYKNDEFRGNVSFISPSLNEKSRTLQIRSSVNNKEGKLRPQMYGKIKIAITEGQNGILIPNEAIVNEENNSYIFIKKSDTTFEQRFVEKGINIGNKTLIKKGLIAGEIYVNNGVFYLKSELKKSEIEGDE
jgi:cobalt-zinc-cadmium efflux system membrane fusion protein